MDEQYRQAQKMEAVGRLAGGVAHDFNNLLTVILGYSDVLLDSMEPDDPLRECVDSIRQAGQRASRLTSQLLAFGRRQLLQPQVLDLNAIVSDTGRLLTRLIGEDIALATVLDPGIGAVRADAGQITQMIMNLAVNARDAMPKGGQLTIETANVDLDDSYTAIHPGVQPGPYVMLAVTDTGTGMSPEVLSHLFEPFFTTKPKGLGTGLGLSMVYGIVKQSGGDVHVYSEVGRGTTFKIYLPRIAATAAAESVVPEPAPASRGETILFVEDDADVAVLVRSMLRDLGYDVLAASNGAEALHICAEHRGAIDLLLTDVVMPGLSGLELADSIRSRRRIPVLYISGYPGGAAVQHSIVVDRDCFIQKPFTAQALGRKIREVLDRG
jgi:CheY-like chemotaxis protein